MPASHWPTSPDKDSRNSPERIPDMACRRTLIHPAGGRLAVPAKAAQPDNRYEKNQTE